MSDLESILGLAGVPLMEKEPAGWTPTPAQEKWLGGANRQDPYIMWRMPGKKPPISYFKDPSDQELAKAIGYVEQPAPVVDKSIHDDPRKAAKTQAAPDNKNKSELEPLDKPAVTKAAKDTRSKGSMTPLDPEPTASDIDPDADGEDMNTNPDMTPFVPKPKTETPPQPADTASGSDDTDYGEEPDTGPKDAELKPADQVLDPEDEAELAKKYDADLKAAAGPNAKWDAEAGRMVDYDDNGFPDYHELYNVGKQGGDKEEPIANLKKAANPQASADNDRGTNQNKMRDTMNKIAGFDKQADADAGLSQQAATNNKVADFDTAFSKDDGLGQMARNNNAKRDTANRVAGYDQQAAADADGYSLGDRARDNAEIAAANAEISDLDKQIADLQSAMMQDNGLDTDLPEPVAQEPDYQQMGPGSFKDAYKKLDLEKPMPNSIKSGEDLYKALGDFK